MIRAKGVTHSINQTYRTYPSPNRAKLSKKYFQIEDVRISSNHDFKDRRGFGRVNDPAFILNIVFVLDMTTPNLVTNLSEVQHRSE